MSGLRTAEEMLADMRSQRELADATSELEQERVERVLAWDRARARVQEARERARWCPFVYFGGQKHYEAHHIDELLAALDELERVEGGL